jgi:hypothetical protein
MLKILFTISSPLSVYFAYLIHESLKNENRMQVDFLVRGGTNLRDGDLEIFDNVNVVPWVFSRKLC